MNSKWIKEFSAKQFKLIILKNSLIIVVGNSSVCLKISELIRLDMNSACLFRVADAKVLLFTLLLIYLWYAVKTYLTYNFFFWDFRLAVVYFRQWTIWISCLLSWLCWNSVLSFCSHKNLLCHIVLLALLKHINLC